MHTDDDEPAPLLRPMSPQDAQQSDWDYVRDQADFREKVRRYEQGFIQEGIDIGIDIGFDIGIEKAARNGLAAGLPNSTIRVMTGLTDEQIDALREQMVREGAIPGKAPDA